MRRLIRISVLALVLLVALGFVLLAASVYTFSTLTDETLIAELRFTRSGDDLYTVRLRTRDGCEEQSFPIYGDQWRLDAQFLKWKYWALLLGLESQYRLDRIEGRYSDVGQQNTRETMAYDLVPETALDIVAVGNALGRLNFLIDATYGSSTYQDIATDRVFYVYKTTTGIITRSEAQTASTASTAQQGLPVEIRRACGGQPGRWKRLVRAVDGAVNAARSLL